MSGAEPRRDSRASPEQLRYARIVDYGMKAGLAVLIAGFIAYASGIAPPLVPLEELPRVWALPVPEYLRETGMAAGWGWLALLGNGDALALAGVALLAGVSAPCLLVLVLSYARRRDWAYFAITLLLVGVLVLAASGVLATAH